MKDPRGIPKIIGPAPASTATGASWQRQLPPDLLKDASNRLGVMSLIGAMLWVFGTLAFHLAMASLGNPLGIELGTTDAIAMVNALLSLALFLYTRQAGRDPRFILDLGLVYMVATGFALGLVFHWAPVPHGWPIMPTLSWLGAVVLMFAALVPNSPGKMAVAGFIAVSMNPVGMLISRARGTWDFGPVSNILVMHYPDYLLVAVAVVISGVVTKLGQQVTKAREMGSYELLTRLGKGGMGEVWRARHRMLARDAAVKLIQPEMLSRDSGANAEVMRRRFEQEAKATASLRSPHTVELYDFGVTEDGVFYYVMELLDGIDLETLVKRFGPQPPARVVHILRQVSRSLADAHSHGMVHRDIKPTNIFLCRLGNEYDFAKVLDFGLVKMTGGGDIMMTAAGATTGTPAYMAPEVALGNTEIDGRTDLYGLGCVAYWLLTGSLVFEEKGATATILAHVRKNPVPPSQRSELAVPASLDRAILMCLAKEPAGRPGSGETLARILDRCEGVEPWTRDEAERWWSAHMAREFDGAGDGPEPMESITATR